MQRIAYFLDTWLQNVMDVGRYVIATFAATKRLQLMAAIAMWGQVSVAASPCDAPTNLADGWAIETNAEAAGFDPVRLCAVLKGFADDHVNFHGLVIERHGRLVAEVYRRGKDESIYSVFASTTDFSATTRHDIRSITKSITSLLWGIAQEQGKTPPLDTPVLDLLPKLKDLKNAGRETITLAHLFNMSSGLAWHEPDAYNSTNDEFGLYYHSSQAHYLFNRPMAAPPGSHFNYNGGGTAVLAQILTDRVGMPLPEFARKYLFEPLGITDWEWRNDVRGRPLAFAGLRMRPRDLARIGRMVLAHGQWQGKQIVPADWLNESTRPRIDVGNGLRYGYQWWAGQVDALGAQYEWSGGSGNGGEKLFLLPGLDMAVVITAGDYNKGEIHVAARQLFGRIVATARE